MQVNSRNIAISSFFLSVFLLLIPQEVQGFVLDPFKAALEGLSEKTGPVAGAYVLTFFFFVIGYAALFISTFLLQGIIAATPLALTVTTGEAADFVRMGWDFTAGIVNLILIIAFIVIAFAVIIGSEKVEMKKALPKLIIVALLVNFTLLFVGIGIDISNFLFNSIANQFFADDGGNLLYDSVTHLFEFSEAQWAIALSYLASTAIGLAVPVLNVAIQVAWMVVGLPTLLNHVLNFIVYGTVMYVLSGVFFLYFLVFLIRIFIIQVLAVLAPLAFFCLIFDQTQRFWKQWLNALIQWLFVGVIFIFLMYFGLAMAPLVRSLANNFDETTGIFGWLLGTVSNIIGEIALLAYFLVIAFIAKSFVPAAVNVAISQATSLAKMATPWAGAIASGTGRGIRNAELKRSERIDNPPPEPKGMPAKIVHRVRNATDKSISKLVRRAHNIAGTSVDQKSQKDVEEKVEEYKKIFGENWGDAASAFNTRLIKTPTDSLAMLQYISEGGAEALEKLTPERRVNLIELASERGDSKTVRNAVRHMPTEADVEAIEEESRNATTTEEKERAQRSLVLARRIQKAMTGNTNKDSEVKKLKEELVTLRESGAPARQIEIKEKEITKARVAATYNISARSLKAQDIENLSGDTFKHKNNSFLKAILENRDISFVQFISKRGDGADILKKLDGLANEPDFVSRLKTTNPTLCNQIKKTPGGRGMLPTLCNRL